MLSQEPLTAPIVSDYLGFLYNKSAVLEFLLPSDDPAMEQLKADQAKLVDGRIKRMRDVVELKFEEADKESDAKENGHAAPKRKWTCPLSGKELGPGVKASYIVPCGHVFADAALLVLDDRKCPQCNETFDVDNVVGILPTTDLFRAHTRKEALKANGLTHSLEKVPVKKRKGRYVADNGADLPSTEGASKGDAAKAQNGKRPAPAATPTINNAGTASLTARVLAEENAKAKRRKLDPNDNLKTLFSSGSSKLAKNADFMTRGFDIPAGAKP